ncbi:rRNA-processing protein efg1 [Penicillium sp. IBT 16267x]|nr:rRNA-processing protein efg1 [Penicillium sp. IBT 16267x]
MSDSRRTRGDSSKRKSRHDSEDLVPRKKQHRHADSDEDMQLEGPGSNETGNPKGKSTPRDKDFTSVNELKRRIRDVKRLLNKGTLPADARIVQERALAGYEQDLADETARRDRSHLIKKYHFVRFLDRKTASKNLNKLLRREKDQELDSKQKARLQQKIHEARVSLNYTIYYPLTEKYISLYPKSQEKSSTEAGAESGSEVDAKDQKNQDKEARPPLWAVVEKCMADNTIDRLREGKLNIGFDGKPITVSAKPAQEAKEKKPKKQEFNEAQYGSRRERRAAANSVPNGRRDQKNYYGRERDRLQDVAPVLPAGAGDDSDGGFFEE